MHQVMQIQSLEEKGLELSKTIRSVRVQWDVCSQTRLFKLDPRSLQIESVMLQVETTLLIADLLRWCIAGQWSRLLKEMAPVNVRIPGP